MIHFYVLVSGAKVDRAT